MKLRRLYFGSSRSDLWSVAATFIVPDIPTIHLAMQRLLDPSTLQTVDDVHDIFEVSSGNKKCFQKEGQVFGRTFNGRALRISFDDCRVQKHGEIRVTLSGIRSEHTAIEADVEFIRSVVRNEHHLQGQAIKLDGTFLPNNIPMSLDDVCLPTAQRQAIRDNTLAFLSEWDAFKAIGIPAKRGVMLYGPPGTGKTMTGKALAYEGRNKVTFVWITAGEVHGPEQIVFAFKLARRLRPAILFFEDMDFLRGASLVRKLVHPGSTVVRTRWYAGE